MIRILSKDHGQRHALKVGTPKEVPPSLHLILCPHLTSPSSLSLSLPSLLFFPSPPFLSLPLPLEVLTSLIQIRYHTIEDFNVDLKAEYSA